jgi:hypothetical protein
MIYFLVTKDVMPNWYYGFCKEIFKGLSDIYSVKQVTDVKLVENLTSSDTVFVTCYKDLKYLNTGARVIYYHQGSGANPYMDCIDVAQETEDLEKVHLHLFSLPTCEKLVKEKYNLVQTATIGFPLALYKYKKYKAVKKKKKIVVSGHITPGKNFYTCTYLLKDLVKEYEVWFSVIEWKEGATGMWTDFYNLDSFRDMGFNFRIITESPSEVNHQAGQEVFYEFLSDASHIFSASLADTIALPIIEGYLCGCYPVTPDIRDFWPQFTDYIGVGYEPFSKRDVERMIRQQPGLHVKVEWFENTKVVERLLEVIA